MIEEWKDIKGYEGLYQVSNLGRIKSLNYNRTVKEKILKSRKNKDGYLEVNLCKNGKPKTFKIHRLVAQAFIPNTDNKPFIDHIDTNPSNNRVENLRWCTQKENNNNHLTINKRKSKIGKLHHNHKPILQFDKNMNFIRKWDCAKDAARKLNINDNHIGSCCNGNRKTSYGYIWKHYDLELYLESKMFKVFNIKNKMVA